MAYQEEKLTKLKSLKQLALRISQDFARKTELSALSGKVDDLAQAVTAADHLKRKVAADVDSIDLTAGDAGQYIYMVPNGGDSGNRYDEYMVLDGALEKVGDWGVDLDGYVQTGDLDTALAGKVDKAEGMGLSANDFTDALREKLENISAAEDTEVAEMLAEVFGAGDDTGDGE